MQIEFLNSRRQIWLTSTEKKAKDCRNREPEDYRYNKRYKLYGRRSLYGAYYNFGLAAQSLQIKWRIDPDEIQYSIFLAQHLVCRDIGWESERVLPLIDIMVGSLLF
jgi:hypothetical protein